MTNQQQVEEVATAIVEQEMENVQGNSSSCSISTHAYPILNGAGDPASVQNLSVQELLLGDAATGFSINILSKQTI